MALSDEVLNETAGRSVKAFQVENAAVIYAGALVGIDISTGRAQNWVDSSGVTLRFAGVALRTVTGNTGVSPIPEVEVDDSGLILKKVSVTGIDNVNDLPDLVYATDENTLTLSATSNVNAIGFVTRYYSGTTADVQLFTQAEYRAAGAGAQ